MSDPALRAEAGDSFVSTHFHEVTAPTSDPETPSPGDRHSLGDVAVSVEGIRAALPFIPLDRIESWLGPRALPELDWGCALFADLSGFTALARRLVEEDGPRRGAERATHLLNRVLEEIIAPIHAWGGSVLSFNGDGLLSWFSAVSDEPGESANVVPRTLACGLAMQDAMHGLDVVDFAGPGQALPMRLKVGIAGGRAHRFTVGDPRIQRLDCLVGTPVARAVAAEQVAQPGDVIVCAETRARAAHISSLQTRRVDGPGSFVAVWVGGEMPPAPYAADRADRLQAQACSEVNAQQVMEWIPQFVWRRLSGGQPQFLAELRPAIAIFARFSEQPLGDTPSSRHDLDSYVQWVQSAFQDAGGSVIQLTLGDKGSYVYGVLGAPQQFDDSATAAAAVARLLAAGPQTGQFRPKAQVGVAQGRMRTGEYGSRTRRAYGVQGSSVNLAARLMMLAQPGQVLIEPAMATLVDSSFSVTEIQSNAFKGFNSPIRVFDLGERLRRHGRFAEGNIGDLARLVRRDEPLAALEHALERADAGSNVWMSVEGAAGTGKSVLLWQFAQSIRRRVEILDCGELPASAGYGVYAALLARLLNLDLSDLLAGNVAGVWPAAGAQGTTDYIAQRVLADALGHASGDESTGLNLAQRREILAGILSIAWRQANDGRTFGLLLDDYHYADPESQTILERVMHLDSLPLDTSVAVPAPGQLAARQVSGGLLLVATRRAEQAVFGEDGVEPTGASSQATAVEREDVAATNPREDRGMVELTIHLAGFTDAESREYLRTRLRGEVDPLAFDLLARLSQGNPLFLASMAEELVQQGGLRQDAGDVEAPDDRERGTWSLAAELFGRLQAAQCLQRLDGVWRLRPSASPVGADLGLPDSLYRLVLTQLDRLPADAALTLKVIAVADDAIDADLLARAHPHATATRLAGDLELLAQRGLLRAAQGRAAPAYHIAGSAVHDVVYGAMLDRQRRSLHAALADAFAEVAPNEVEALAYHLFRADLGDPALRARALTALEAAADAAQRRFALESALGHVDCLLQIERRWTWLQLRFDLLHGLGLRRQQAQLLEELRADPSIPGMALALAYARYYEAISDYDAAQNWAGAALEAGLDAVRTTNERDGILQPLCMLGQIARRRGDFQAAAEFYREALPLANEPGQHGEILYGLGIAARHQRDLDEARRLLGQALVAFRASAARANEAQALTALGVLGQMERRYAEAYQYHEQALALRRAINDWPGEGASLVSLAQLRRAQGFQGEAIDLLRAARRIHRALRDRWWENRILNEIGVIYLVAGMLSHAQRTLEEGRELARQIGDQAGEMVLLLNLGQVLRDQGALESAEVVLSHSLEMATARAEQYIQAQCHSDLARTWLAAGRHDAATDAARTAIELLEDLGLSDALSTDLATLAQATLEVGRGDRAAAYAHRIIDLLDSGAGEDADFPQRDYWIAYRVLAERGDSAASHALAQSRLHLNRMAERFRDEEMRQAFLSNIEINRAILASSPAYSAAKTGE